MRDGRQTPSPLAERLQPMATTMEPQTAKPAAPGQPAPARWLAVPQNRWLAVGLAAAVVLLGAWFVIVSGQRKQEFAGRELDQARNVAESGNLPLAASQLQKVISTYAGTPAAEEAILTLNQVRIVNGQQELAASGLQEFVKSSPSSEYLAPAYALLGEALENAKRPGEAAAAFVSASEHAAVDYLRAEYLVDAGRAWTSAGKRDQAIEAYRKVIAKYPKTESKVEAQVRLAELTAGKM